MVENMHIFVLLCAVFVVPSSKTSVTILFLSLHGWSWKRSKCGTALPLGAAGKGRVKLDLFFFFLVTAHVG